jgi:hypothetical protein
VRQYYYYRTVQIVSFFIFMFCFYWLYFQESKWNDCK